MAPQSSIEAESFVDILRRRAAFEPDRHAYSFLNGRLDEEVVLTYRDLDFHARSVAGFLQERGARGQRVLVVCPPGLPFVTAFFGCMYSGAIAVPAYPPQSFQINQTLPRLRAIVRDSEPSIGLVAPDILALIERQLSSCEELRSVQWLIVPNAGEDGAANWKPPDIHRDTVALLQYTSGSTSTPKGVMVTHGNLIANSERSGRAFRLRPDITGVSWLPPYHDMGLMGGLLQPVYTGFSAYFLTPFSFLQRPVRWLQAISKFRATVSGGPDFAYGLCVRRIGVDETKDLDLSCWKVAFNGAEPIRSETLNQFASAFSSSGFDADAFSPCYGLAEATLMVSGQYRNAHSVLLSRNALQENRASRIEDPGSDDAVAFVASGPVDEHVAIASPVSLDRCGDGSIGEIWVSGPNVGTGYWKRPEESEQTFNAYLSDSREGPFLRTGDLGFIVDGELFVTGRIKDLIIIAGRNHYPQDIESTAERSHPSIRTSGCAAFTIDADGAEQLVIAAELEKRPQSQAAEIADEIAAVSRAIKRAVAEEHDIQVREIVALKSGALPKTSSGKIQRRACRAAFLDNTLLRLSSRPV
jgi:acyl-CoA synthetase (AMP-forming)/AMP-acid ligase II